MSVAVLKSSSQVSAARSDLESRSLGPKLVPESLRNTVTYIVRTLRPPPRPDWSKAWDVNTTLGVVEATAGHSARIVDLGAFNSAIIPALVRLGYSDVVGIDLDPRLPFCPYADRVTYIVANFHDTGLASATCDIVTAISTIEHGWNRDKLLGEVARILKPGGLFIASTDYWPQKIETSDITAFGLPWIIFSEQELREVVAAAATFGLVQEGSADFEANEPVIQWSGRSYTFAHIVLRRA